MDVRDPQKIEWYFIILSFSTLDPSFHWDVSQGSNKVKSHRLR